ncbi:MAG: hypothetical protein PUD92_04400 [Clostridiales bacterium]|nr:hypothetical protein [Clostridiales bacterium]
MKKEVLEKSRMYKIFNEITLKHEIIIFGSTFTANFPFYELTKKYLLSNAIYNRSIDGLTISEADKILNDCVFDAKPDKIFYSFEADSMDMDLYKDILHKTQAALPSAKIYVLSVQASASDSLNTMLKLMCADYNAEFIDIDYTKSYEAIYRQLTPFFRSKKITFSEALQMA